METVQYLRALGRSWFLVVIALIAGGAGGYAVYHNATPMYRSEVRMVVKGTGDEVTSRVLAVQRAEAIAQVASTGPAVKAAAGAAGYPGASPTVIASSSNDSPFVDVRVQDTEPRRAHAIADAFAATLPAVLVQLEGPTDTQVALTNLSDASLPSSPYSPDRNKDVGLGLAAGLVLGVFVALLREVFNRTVRDSDELERLTDLTILGTVPRDLPKKLMPAVTDPRSPRAEAYRQIRTTLLNAQNRGLQTIAVTSAALGEGKTSVATNLAAVFSRAGHRVAIIDADLRRPRVAAFFGLRPRYGLTEVLSGVTTLDQALHVMDDGRLAVLTSGRIPANPSEALGGIAMERVIEKLAGEYEYVIVDTPPVLPVTDASVLAPKVDGVVLVARIQHTTRDRIRRAKSTLERVNATVLGVVPNQAGKGADRDYRYPYRYAPSRRRGGEPEQPPIASAPGPSAGTRSQQRQGPSEPARRRHAPPPPTAPEPEPVRYQPPQQVHYPQSQEYPAPQQYPPPPQFPSQAAPVSYAPLPPPVNGQERRPAHGYPEQQDW